MHDYNTFITLIPALNLQKFIYKFHFFFCQDSVFVPFWSSSTFQSICAHCCTLLNLYCFLSCWVLTESQFGYFLSPFCFNGFVKLIVFCPWYIMQWLHTWLNTIIVKQYCPCSFLHNSSRIVSCTQDLSWDITDNVLRVNLTLTLLTQSALHRTVRHFV